MDAVSLTLCHVAKINLFSVSGSILLSTPNAKVLIVSTTIFVQPSLSARSFLLNPLKSVKTRNQYLITHHIGQNPRQNVARSHHLCYPPQPPTYLFLAIAS